MANTYDFNTGKLLAPGEAQSLYNTKTGQQIGNSSGTNIPPEDLSSFQKANPGLDFNKEDLNFYNKATPMDATAIASATSTNLPQTPVDTSGAELIGKVTGDYVSQLTGEAGKKQAADTGLASVIADQRALEQKPTRTAEINAQEGVVEKRTAVDELDKLIRGRRAALNSQLYQIENTPGSTQAANAAFTSNATRQAGFDLANYSIARDSAEGNYTSAFNKAQALIDAEFKPLEARLETDKYIYEQSKADYSKAEQTRIEAVLKARESAITDAKAEKKDLQDTKNSLLQEATQEGAPSDVVLKIQQASTKADAIVAGGKYVKLQDRQLKAAQIANIYSEINDRRVKADQAAKTLPGPIQTRVQSVASQFDNEQIVKDYNNLSQAQRFVDSLPNKTDNPADDQGLIYAFAKAMDPSSAVKEGEYNTVAEYSQALLTRYGLKAKRIYDNSGFLTEQARSFLKSTINSKLRSNEKAYENVYAEYGRRIDKITGSADGTEYITDYRIDPNDALRSQLKQGEVLVKDKKTGQVGAIPANELNSNYEKI